MDKRNLNKHKSVANVEERLIDLPEGSFREYGDRADEILRNAQVIEIPEQDFELPKPYFADDLIEQYKFFRENIHNPQRVFYPCCSLDISPIKGFPGSEVVLMDSDTRLKEVMEQERIKQFISGDVLAYNPNTPFDLVIALNPSLSSKDLTRHLSDGGYVLANNWHNNAYQLLEDSNFEDVGTIDRNENGVYLAKGDFSKIEPNQFATYFYVFRKLGDIKK